MLSHISDTRIFWANSKQKCNDIFAIELCTLSYHLEMATKLRITMFIFGKKIRNKKRKRLGMRSSLICFITEMELEIKLILLVK